MENYLKDDKKIKERYQRDVNKAFIKEYVKALGLVILFSPIIYILLVLLACTIPITG